MLASRSNDNISFYRTQIGDSREEQRLGIIEQYDTFAAALQQMGMIGIWDAKPLLDGDEVKQVLPNIPRGPAFKEVMDEQQRWLTTHPGSSKEPLVLYLQEVFNDYAKLPKKQQQPKNKKSHESDER